MEHTLKLGKFSPKYPVIQGGMGIGISLANLAAAVSNAGGIGVISGSNWVSEKDFGQIPQCQPKGSAKRSAKPENWPRAVSWASIFNSHDPVHGTGKNRRGGKIDFIISGAGLPLELPALIKGSETLAIPIISSPKALRVLLTRWLKRDEYIPPAVILEGPKAGGHLGFSNAELASEPDLFELIKEVKKELTSFEEANHCQIALIAGGGIFDGDDVKKALESGADGVQVGSRFAAT